MHLGQTCSPIISGPVKIVGYELLDSPRQAAKKAGSKAAEVCTVELSSICLEEKANEERAIFWGFLFVFFSIYASVRIIEKANQFQVGAPYISWLTAIKWRFNKH